MASQYHIIIYYYITEVRALSKMADATKFLVNNLLCFIQNRIGKMACKPLKSLIMDFYSSDDISSAREMLLVETDSMQMADFPNIPRRRRHSINKHTLDIEDINLIFTFLDENNRAKDLPKFLSDNPDSMPSCKLIDGDLEFLYQKIQILNDNICEIKANLASEMADLGQVQTSVTKLDSSFQQHYSTISQSVDELKAKVSSIANVNIQASRPPSHNRSLRRHDHQSIPVVPSMNDSTTVNSNIDRISGISAVIPIKSHRWSSMIVSDSADVSADASASEMEQTGDDQLYSTVLSKVSKRSSKRKEISPNSQNQDTKRSNVSSAGVSYAAMVGANRFAVSRPNNRVIGNSESCNSLKAAPPKLRSDTVKAVFCVSNVDRDFSVEHLREHCKNLNVNILFCFDITSDHHHSRSFKLAVRAQDEQKIINPDSWPSRLVVKPWIYKEDASRFDLSQLNADNQLKESILGTERSVTGDMVENENRQQINASSAPILVDVADINENSSDIMIRNTTTTADKDEGGNMHTEAVVTATNNNNGVTV